MKTKKPQSIRFSEDEILRIRRLGELNHMEFSPFCHYVIMKIVDVAETAIKSEKIDEFMLCCKEFHEIFMTLVKSAKNGRR